MIRTPLLRTILALTLLLGLLSARPALAAEPVEGIWKTIDDETGDPKSYVRTWVENGVLRGRIEKLIRKPDEEQDPVCDECEGERHNQRITGMTIIWDMRHDPDEGIWTGGEILDPGNGKIYRCNIDTSQDGQKLNVRGYIGFSLIGRTQVWHRVSEVPGS